MTPLAIADALRTQFITMVDRPATVFDNSEQSVNTPYLVFEFVPINNDSVSLDYSEMQSGILQVTIVTSENEGINPALRIAERIKNCFPAGWSQGRLRVDHPAQIVKGYPDMGLWRMPVQIRWRVLPE